MPQRKKPTSLHVLQGTYQKCRHEGNSDIEASVGQPEKPDWLTGQASKEWDKTIEVLSEAGYLAKTDSMALATYCELVAEFSANPPDFPAGKLGQLRLLMADLGMTPSARAKMPVQKDDDEGNPFAGM